MPKFKNLITETGSFLFEDLNHNFKNPFETDDKNLTAHLCARSDWELIKEEKSAEEKAAEKAAAKEKKEQEERGEILEQISSSGVVLENFEELSNSELKKALSDALSEKEFSDLRAEASALEIKFPDNISFKKLKILVEESKNDNL